MSSTAAARRPLRAHPATVADRRRMAGHLCRARAAGAGLPGYADPNVLADARASALVPVGAGSWLSKAFKSVTGTKLSKVTGSIVGSVPVVGGILNAAINGKDAAGSSPQPQGQTTAPATTAHGAAPAVQGQDSTASLLNSLLIMRALEQPSQPAPTPQVVYPQAAPSRPIDQNTLILAGAAVLAVALIARR